MSSFHPPTFSKILYPDLNHKQRSRLAHDTQAKFQQELIDNRRDYNSNPKRAFWLLNKRVEWLNDKIAIRQANNQSYYHYVDEREALIWLMDKVKELCEKLLVKSIKCEYCNDNGFVTICGVQHPCGHCQTSGFINIRP